MVSIAQIAGVIGVVVGIPASMKIGGMLKDYIYKNAQNTDEITNQRACQKLGFHWYNNKCHREPKTPYKYRDPIDGTTWDTYADLCDHYKKAHPGVSCPPLALRPDIRIDMGGRSTDVTGV